VDDGHARSALGCYLSVLLDTPTGATIVVTFGAVLLLMFVLHLVVHHRRDARALRGAVSAHGGTASGRRGGNPPLTLL